jgi:hypothetical protein
VNFFFRTKSRKVRLSFLIPQFLASLGGGVQALGGGSTEAETGVEYRGRGVTFLGGGGGVLSCKVLHVSLHCDRARGGLCRILIVCVRVCVRERESERERERMCIFNLGIFMSRRDRADSKRFFD